MLPEVAQPTVMRQYDRCKENKWVTKEIGDYDNEKRYLICGLNCHGLSENLSVCVYKI
jgi:hypothetical protein